MADKKEIKKAEVTEKDIVVIQKKAGNLVERATNFLVDSDKAYGQASQAVAWIRNSLKKFEVARKFYTDPLNDQVKKINARYKGYKDPFIEADKLMSDKMLDYRREQNAIKEKADREAQAEVERIAKLAEVPKEEVVKALPTKEVVKTTADTTIVKNWKFRVIDISKVPAKYLTTNAEVNKDIKSGTRDIPGLEIYSEDGIRTR